MKRCARLKIVVATSLIWTICLSSCGSIRVKWWFLDALQEKSLIRRKGTEIVERQSYEASDGYFCVSPPDAELIINAIKTCQVKP